MANAAANPTIIQYFGPAGAIHLTPSPNQKVFFATSTFGDLSTRLRNWIMPQLIPRTDPGWEGFPSIGYMVRFYNGDPGAGGTEIPITQDQSGAVVGWFIHFGTGAIKVASSFSAVFNANDVWMTGFLYIGQTLMDYIQSLTGLEYKGTWDASTNTPAIPVADPSNNGHYYVVNIAGSTVIDGESDWGVGDWIISNGTVWQKIDQSYINTIPLARDPNQWDDDMDSNGTGYIAEYGKLWINTITRNPFICVDPSTFNADWQAIAMASGIASGQVDWHNSGWQPEPISPEDELHVYDVSLGEYYKTTVSGVLEGYFGDEISWLSGEVSLLSDEVNQLNNYFTTMSGQVDYLLECCDNVSGQVEQNRIDILTLSGIIDGLQSSGMVYTNEEPTPTAVGGIPAGSTFDEVPLNEMWDRLLYPFQSPSVNLTTVPVSTLREYGDTVANPELHATVTKGTDNITSVRFYRGVTMIHNVPAPSASGGVETYTDAGFTVSGAVSYKAEVSDGLVTVQDTESFTFVYPYYWGVGSQGLNGAAIQALTKSVSSRSDKTVTYSPSFQVYYFAYPQSYGPLSRIYDQNNFDITADFFLRTSSMAMLDGTNQIYNIYEFNNLTTQTNFQITYRY